jgi:AcrR family transcriptional regulator
MVDRAGSAEGPGTASGGRSARKRRAILEAATAIFLRSGYLAASMDEIAAASSVSKQTIYKQFTSKEALFVAVVTSLVDEASDTVHNDAPVPTAAAEVAAYLEAYGLRQLKVVLTPRLIQLRRMVIGEAGRFPELGKALYDSGPRRAMKAFAAALERLSGLGLLQIGDADTAAAHFNWLVMGGPLNAVMFLGDDAAPDARALRRHVAEAVRVFLAAYGGSGGRSVTR